MRLLSLLLLAYVFAACTSTPTQQTPAPTAETLTGSVDITYPYDGSVIYSEALFVMGTASNLPGESFVLQLVGADETILARNEVQVSAGEWRVELPHGYSGEPLEVSILSLPQDADIPSEAVYDLVNIVIASHDFRPEGAFATITAPQNEDVVGGETIVVSGTGSGLFEGTLLLELAAEDGTVVDSAIITINDPSFINEIPWTAELRTNDYTGPAQIRAFMEDAATGNEVTLATVRVTLERVVG